jgi:hypothetical protein
LPHYELNEFGLGASPWRTKGQMPKQLLQREHVSDLLRSDETVAYVAERLDLLTLTWEPVEYEEEAGWSTAPIFCTALRQRSVEDIVRDVLTALVGDGVKVESAMDGDDQVSEAVQDIEILRVDLRALGECQ